jgi:hypothetical protein
MNTGRPQQRVQDSHRNEFSVGRVLETYSNVSIVVTVVSLRCHDLIVALNLVYFVGSKLSIISAHPRSAYSLFSLPSPPYQSLSPPSFILAYSAG